MTTSDSYLLICSVHSLPPHSSPASNISYPLHSPLYSIHQGFKLSPFPWSQHCKYSLVDFFFFFLFGSSLILFHLSGWFQIASPLQTKVLCQRQTLARCFVPFISVPLGPEKMLPDYWISSEIIQLQWRLLIYRPLCILTVHIQWFFGL